MRAPHLDERLSLEQLETYRALLNLREHDIDRLHAEGEAFLIYLDFLLSAGRIEAAHKAIRERLQ